ncbi:MAG: hypothetical protein QNJ72_15205 [Pleurocapsa sp. MO_226.B13]|nr:hypothetical protein [Pleurocapsa sp. MO_226.B13]
MSPNKTLQGIYSQLVWDEEQKISRRAMHEAVFEAGWKYEELMRQHRKVLAPIHQGKGREIIALDWTFSYHPHSEKIFAAKEAYDYVNRCGRCYQTVVTASISNGQRIDGIAVEVQHPNYEKEELAYLEMTAKENYEQMEQVRERLLELLHDHKNRLAYRKRTEIAVDLVRQLESSGKFPNADYGFDQGVLSRPLTEVIEASGKHWVTEVECSRNIMWHSQWQRVDQVTEELKTEHPESFRYKLVRCRNGEQREIWAFTKVVRLKKYGRKRLVIVHEKSDLSDSPRFLLTDAKHWDASRVFATWSYRWSVEIFHEFSKQLVGFESAQLRNEEAVKRHFCLSCVAQSVLQTASCSGGKSERFNLTQENEPTIGQRLYSLTREALHNLLELSQSLWLQGKSTEQVLEVMMPS